MSEGDDPIDFSPLDPSRDPERWQRRVAAVTAGVRARRRRYALEVQLLEWARPALLVAASLTLVVWWGAARQSATPRHDCPASATPWTVACWVQSGEEPSVPAMLLIMEAAEQ
jgi:hypothetical protein